MIDTNVYLSRWPFRRLFGDEPADLVARLHQGGVTQAWAGSFDALLHRDIGGVNERLAADCRRHGGGMLVPFGAVNPRLPDWVEDLRRCRELHRMPGIRLHPNYHGYSLRDPEFAEVLRRATEAGLIVQLAVQMEDERTQHPLMRVPPVDLAPLAEVASGVRGLRMVVLNYNRSPLRARIGAAGNVWFDIAMVEGVAGVATAEGAVFGSYFPFFNFQSAALKVVEAGLSAAEESALREETLAGCFGRGPQEKRPGLLVRASN